MSAAEGYLDAFEEQDGNGFTRIDISRQRRAPARRCSCPNNRGSILRFRIEAARKP
jgi:hypothetical protein